MVDFEYGGDSGIANFIPDLRSAARLSNGFVLEIGTGTGQGSTIAFEEGLQQCASLDKLHISVDLNIPAKYRPSVPWWHMVQGDSRDPDTFNKVVALCGPRAPGLIFIDTDHYYEHMQAELALWHPIACSSTVWLFHDTWIWGVYNHMTEAIKEFASANRWVYDDVSTVTHGLGRMVKL